MARWHRTIPFSSEREARRVERWEYRAADGRTRAFEVDVQAGKPLDVLALKGTDLTDVRKYADFLRGTASQLYGPSSGATRQPNCPICCSELEPKAVELHVFGVPYLRCTECGHVAVGLRPAPGALDRVFAESETHSSTYVDRAAVETRMKQIIEPKLEWCLEHARRRSGRAPKRIIDVGAGAGHFLAGAKRRGMMAEGFERSRASRAFAKEVFDLELRADDFIAAKLQPADLVTFWGLLEYLQEPRAFLAAARRAVAKDGLLVVEVPRADALGTRVQADAGAVVARHMDPTTHVNAFSDESLCTALVEEGFGPVAAWYFGMDAYEAFVQAALQESGAKLSSDAPRLIPALQQSLDLGRRCDDIVVAAVPL